MRNKIEIAFITDPNYVKQTYITIKSAINSKNKNSVYDIYVIGLNLSNDDKIFLQSLSNEEATVNIIEKTEIEANKIDNMYLNNYSSAILLKLELEKILSFSKKVIFLDADIIVNKDLSELYKTDLSDCYIAACKDIIPMVFNIKNNNKINKNYFNVGVMVINLELIRKDSFFEKSRKYYIENGKNFQFPEQDTLNDLIGDKLKVISPKYNYMSFNKVIYTKKQLMKFYNIKNQQELGKNNIVIYHYAGIKPWKDTSTPDLKLWEDVYKQTEFYNQTLKRTHKYNLLIKYCAFFKNQFRIFKNYKVYKIANVI